jgi:hypothetical protein
MLTASVHLADFLFTYVDKICHLSHLKSPRDFALLTLVFLQRNAPLQFEMEGRMKKRILTGLMVAVLGTAVALASPALARGGGGGGGGGGHGGGGHGGGGGWHGGGGGWHGGGGMRFSGGGFAGPRFAHAAFAPRFAHAGFHRPFFHHRFHHRRFAFIGAPYLYAGYNYGCLRRVWTAYGPRWVNVCDYGNGYY